MSKLSISVCRNYPEHTNTFRHRPFVVMLDNGQQFESELEAHELLHQLKARGLPDEDLMRAAREIEERGQTVIELAGVSTADLERAVRSHSE